MSVLDLIFFIKENNPDKFLLYFKFLIGLIIILLFFFYNKLFIKNNTNFNYNLFIILILVLTITEYYFVGNHSAYDWLSIHEIPLIKKDLNIEYLINDFYTNRAFNTPKIIYVKFINFINIFNINLDIFLLFINILVILLTPIFTFKILTNFNSSSYFFIYNNNFLTISISLIFSLGYLSLIDNDLGGWSSFTNWKFINPMTISNLICLYLFYNIQKKNYNNFLNYILIFIATLLHPLTAIFYYILIYFILNDYKKNLFKNVLLINFDKLFLFIPIFFGSIIIFITFYSVDNHNSEIYSNIYTHIRHPHHYLVSSFFSIYYLIWICLPVIFLFIFSIIKNYLGIKISIYFSIISISSVGLQFFFSEVYIVNLISTKLSPIRIYCYIFFVYIILLNILLNNLSYKIELSNNSSLPKFIINLSIFIFLSVILLTLKKEPLHRIPDAQNTLKFTKNDLSSKYYSDSHSEWLLSFIRAYSDKEIYSDNLFIFEENTSLAWLELKNSGKKIRNLEKNNFNEFKCELFKKDIDAYLANKDYTFFNNQSDIIYENDTYLIFTIDNKNC